MPRERTRTPERAGRPTARGIRAARAWSHLTGDEFAALIGVSPRTLQRWEAGETAPREHAIKRTAAAIGVPECLVRGDFSTTTGDQDQ